MFSFYFKLQHVSLDNVAMMLKLFASG